MRLVGENIEPGVYTHEQAQRIADEQGVDLVEISPTADPPANATNVVLKEIRFGPQTDEHDYEFKRKHAIRFLEEGSKIKAYVFFRGRSIIYKDQGEILLLRLATDLEEYGKVDQMPKVEGKQMFMLLSPKKKK